MIIIIFEKNNFIISGGIQNFFGIIIDIKKNRQMFQHKNEKNCLFFLPNIEMKPQEFIANMSSIQKDIL